MSAPERIFVQWPQPNSTGLAFTCQARPPAMREEYTRADLAQATTAAAVAAVIERAAEAVSQSCWRHEGDDPYSQGMDRGATQQNAVDHEAIRALADPTGLAALEAVTAQIVEQAARKIEECFRKGINPEKWPDHIRALAAIQEDKP